MASSSNRHPIVLLGAAASLITVLSFFGVRGWPGSEPLTPAASDRDGRADRGRRPVAGAGAGAFAEPHLHLPQPDARAHPRAHPAPAKVSCVIEDRLGEGQVAETVTVRFGAKEWELTVDESDLTDRLTLRFPHAGRYSYAIETETETSDGGTLHGEGEGTITCRGGQTFQLVGDYSTDPVTVSLTEG